MKRYYIIEGDVTSACGIVQRHTGSAQTTKVYDKIVSNIGDKINCPACGAVGTIAAVGHRQPFGNHSNIPAMENDICLCKCSPPPILKHSQELFFQNVDYSIASAMEAFNLSLPNLQQDLNNNLVEDKETECFCNRDIKLPEFLDIIQGMRDAEKIKGTAILNDPRCIVVGDKSHTKLLEHLNKTLAKYEINSCIRKIHFLTQTYWEGDRFRTTSEYDKGDYLNPGRHPDAKANGNTLLGDGPRYKGRGFMQLTWRDNYKRYFKFILENKAYYSSYLPKDITLDQLLDRKNNYSEIIAKDLFLATDSAGWFWVHGKILNKGSGNLNIQADADNVKKISLWVNGGNNGGKERVAYWTNLKKVMKYDQCKNKK